MLRRSSVIAATFTIALLGAGTVATGAGDGSNKLRATVVDQGTTKRLALESYCYGRPGEPSGCGLFIGVRGPRIEIEDDTVERFAVGSPAKRVVGLLLERREDGTLVRRERSTGQLVPGSGGLRWTAEFPDAGRRWEYFRLEVLYRRGSAPQVRGKHVRRADFVARRR
ncbi:hypothetical protein HJD18_03180 [Thermoleophilia bacterium SCSIO 60948]|nr:hypothetical protein HJD18_03180 [Thermoleophilia bacterium SCSIO 60948]